MTKSCEESPLVEFNSRNIAHPPTRTTAHWKPGDPVEYISKDTLKFEMPVFSGQHYEARVPDTLDLSERAHLGLNVLTEARDTLCDYNIYFNVFFTNPPTMMHDCNDWCEAKFVESLPLLRTITGSNRSDHVDRIRMTARLHMVGPDGLIWEPVKGRPWMKMGLSAASASYDVDSLGDQWFVVSMSGRFLGAVALYYLLTEDNFWKSIGERIVDGFCRTVVYRDDFAFFERWISGRDMKTNPNASMNRDANIHAFWVIQGLVQFYRTAGYEPARELAGKLVRCARRFSGLFDANGKWTGVPHHHTHALATLAMLDYALEVGDKELLEFTRKSYECGRSIGNALIGFFPEFYEGELYETHLSCEACEVADMIGIAVKLSQAGVGDYWDDADRYLRNQFAEMQLTDTERVYRYTRTLEATDVRPNESGDRVVERNIGAFAGYAGVNEWRQDYSKTAEPCDIMHCCTGNSTRAIYYAWESILQFEKGHLKINLLLNRASPWADVDSHIPYEGRVDIRVKQNCDAEVRIPDWAELNQVKCTVEGKPRPFTFDGRYAKVGGVKASETVRVSFTIKERTVDVEIVHEKYRLMIKGNDVVDVDPPGKIIPLYQRSHYRKDVRWRTVNRFVPQKNFRW